MVKTNQFAEDATEIAARLERSRAMGEQLPLLPGEPAEADKPKRGKGKAQSQLREWLAARGLRMPEDQLVAIAGLDRPGDPVQQAMEDAERILAWSFDGAQIPKGGTTAATPHQRREVFGMVYSARMRAAEALLPYVAPKVTPDAAPPPAAAQIVVIGAPTGQQSMRDVTPSTRRIGPPPMPHEVQQNQRVSEPASDASDETDRTK